jgi:hypothetical protein
MPRPKHIRSPLAAPESAPLAVPLREAARILDVPSKELRKLGVKPYTATDGRQLWSLSQLRRALGREKTPKHIKRNVMEQSKHPYSHRATIRV